MRNTAWQEVVKKLAWASRIARFKYEDPAVKASRGMVAVSLANTEGETAGLVRVVCSLVN